MTQPPYFQTPAWTPCPFAVDHANTRGTTLVVTTNQPNSSSWFGRQAKPVLPSDVAPPSSLPYARNGPHQKPGSPFCLDLSAGFAPSP